MPSYIPLISGLVLPIATFINFQAITAPGWLAFSEEGSLFRTSRPHEPSDSITYLRQKEALVLCSLSLLSGIISVISLFLRMLEKKIKWTTRLFILGAYGQGCLSLLLALFFIFTLFTSQKAYQFAEGIVYTVLCSLLSLVSASLAHYQQYLNREQIYVYIQNELSAAQRQLMILSICTFSYLIVCSLVYSEIEGWDIDDGLYWAVATLATIGFGDVTPKTIAGKALLPLMASCGIVLIASHIYAIRNVLLEMITYSLASQFSKTFGHSSSHPLLDSSPDIHDAIKPFHSPAMPYHIVPASDEFQHHHHSNYDALDLAASDPAYRPLLRATSMDQVKSKKRAVSPLLLPDPHLPFLDNQNQQLPPPALSLILESNPLASHPELVRRTFSIKRSNVLPHMYIHTTNETSRFEQKDMIVQVTQETFRRQVVYAALAVLLNISVFGGIFAWLEQWHFLEGVYFSYVALMTIGYGDYALTNEQSRSLFIWHVFAGIASITYFSSMVAERAMNQWTVQVAKIEKRVDRYTKKATLKKMYKTKETSQSLISPPVAQTSQDGQVEKVEKGEMVAVSLPRPPRRTSSVFYRNGNVTDIPSKQDKHIHLNRGTVQVETPYSASVPVSWNFATRRHREKRRSFPLTLDSTDDEEDFDSWDGLSSDEGISDKGKQKQRHSMDLSQPSSSRFLGWNQQESEQQPLLDSLT